MSKLQDSKFLVCVSANYANAEVIQVAASMARAHKGELTALFVETSKTMHMSEENRKRVRYHMDIAKQAGAYVETTYGDDVAYQIVEYAKLANIQHIILGRAITHRPAFINKKDVYERLLMYESNLIITCIPEQSDDKYTKDLMHSQTFLVSDIFKSTAIICIATLLGTAFDTWGFSEANIITVYILGVLIIAIVTSKRWYSLLSSLISVLVFNFFFTTPRYTLTAYDTGYPATFLIMFFAAFITSTLAVKIKQLAVQSTQVAYRTKILLDTNQLLQQAQGKDNIISITAQQLMKLLDKDIIFYPNQKDPLKEFSMYQRGNENIKDCLCEKEKKVALWVLKNKQQAGVNTNAWTNAMCLYIPVHLNDRIYGVFAIVMRKAVLESFENTIVVSILGECALALENDQIAKEKEAAAIIAKNEQLRANLLRSISHDLRTPLTSISGNADILLSNQDTLQEDKKQVLYQTIYDDSLWLISLVENLLSITRIEDGTMHLRLTSELLDEVIVESLQHLTRHAKEHTIEVTQDAEYLLAKMDARLILQVFVNLLDNAIKYTQVGSTIHIHTCKKKDMIEVTITDNGPGISDEDKLHIFDMFYTVNIGVVDSHRSLGLGLSLCKSIINAHGGEIFVEDHKPQGSVFRFTLPSEEVQDYE